MLGRGPCPIRCRALSLGLALAALASGCSAEIAGDGRPGATADRSPSPTSDSPGSDAIDLELSPVQAEPGFTVDRSLPPDEIMFFAPDPWLLVRSAAGPRLAQVDGDTGEELSSIVLPVRVVFPVEGMVQGSVLWLPATVEAGGVDPTLLRIDVATGRVDTIPLPGFGRQVELVDGVPWVVTDQGGAGLAVQSYSAGGPLGEPTMLPVQETLGAVITATPGGVFDCLFGEWGFTPVGTGDRVLLDLGVTGCNAVHVDGAVLTPAEDGSALLVLPTDGGPVRRLEFPRPVAGCNGPSPESPSTAAVLYCFLPDGGLLLIEADVAADSVEQLGEFREDSPDGYAVRQTPDRRAPGQPVVLAKDFSESSSRSYLLTVDSAGVPSARLVQPETIWSVARFQNGTLWLHDGSGAWLMVPAA